MAVSRKRSSTPAKTYSMADALAASVAAYRYNANDLVRTSSSFANDRPMTLSNAAIIKDILNGEGAVAVTDEDRKLADEYKTALATSITFSLIQGMKVNDFTKNIHSLVEKEELASHEIGLLAWAPKVIADLIERDTQRETIINAAVSDEPLGKVGEKVSIDFTMVKSFYVQKLNCYSVTGHDGKGHAVQFLTQHHSLTKSFKLKGKVRKFGVDQYNGNVMTTSLNFVKEEK